MSNLWNNIEIREVGAPTALANNTDNNSDRIDMANHQGVIFVAVVDDSVATGVATLKIEQNTTDSDSGMAALTGTTATATCAVNDDLNGKVLIAGVDTPRERYVQAVRTSATANIAFGSVIAILYGKRVKGVTDGASVLDSAYAVSPAEV